MVHSMVTRKPQIELLVREGTLYDSIFPGAAHPIPVGTLCRCGGLFTQHNRSHTSAPVIPVSGCELSMHVEHNYSRTNRNSDRHVYVESRQPTYECDFNVF